MSREDRSAAPEGWVNPQPGMPNPHHVDGRTGASEIRPYLGSAAGRRPAKRSAWRKWRRKWEDFTGQ